MAALDFPATPTVGQLYPDPIVPDIPQYRWDGFAWISVGTPEEFTYVKRAGDTMAGALKLYGNPIHPLDAVPMQYAVAKTGDTMVGHLSLPTGPAANQAVRRDYIDTYGGILNTQITGKVGKAGGSEAVMAGDLTVTRSGAGQGGHGLIQFGSNASKYIFFDGSNWNFNLGGIVAPLANINGVVTVNAPTNSTGLYVYGATAASAYAIDAHARYIETGGVIGWSINNTGYGIIGAHFAGYYYSLYGNSPASIPGGVFALSDGRVKSVTRDADQSAALAAVNAVAVKQFTPKAGARTAFFGADKAVEDETLYGWIAQDVEQVVPIAVRDVGIPAHDKPMRDAVGGNTFKAINDRYMLTTLWSAVQRLSAQNDELRAEIEALKAAR